MEMLGIAVVGIIAVILIVKLLSAPIRFAFKMLINALVGFAVLFLLPTVLTITNSFINWLNAVVVGVLGAPGVVLLLLLKYFL